MKFKTYETIGRLKMALHGNFPEGMGSLMRSIITKNMWSQLTDAEIALAISILSSEEPILGFRLYSTAQQLQLDWKVSKKRILRALCVYSWANGDALTITNSEGKEEVFGDKKDIYLFYNFDRVALYEEKYAPMNLK